MAHWLQDQGVHAYAVRGGVAALLGEPSPGDNGGPVVATVPVPTSRALAALRHPRFRLYSAGVLFSLIGNWVEAAAFGYVVLLLGGSAAALGVIGFLNTIPNIVFALPGGALADRYDRRKLLLVFQGANMGVATLLAVLWATGELTVPLGGGWAGCSCRPSSIPHRPRTGPSSRPRRGPPESGDDRGRPGPSARSLLVSAGARSHGG